jgi:hypothetical protein
MRPLRYKSRDFFHFRRFQELDGKERKQLIKHLRVTNFLNCLIIYIHVRAVILNFLGLTLVVVLCSLTGMVMVAKYYDCNPLQTKVKQFEIKHTLTDNNRLEPNSRNSCIFFMKEVAKSDQLVPFFAQQTVKNVPGLLGLFVSGLTSASMR